MMNEQENAQDLWQQVGRLVGWLALAAVVVILIALIGILIYVMTSG